MATLREAAKKFVAAHKKERIDVDYIESTYGSIEQYLESHCEQDDDDSFHIEIDSRDHVNGHSQLIEWSTSDRCLPWGEEWSRSEASARGRAKRLAENINAEIEVERTASGAIDDEIVIRDKDIGFYVDVSRHQSSDPWRDVERVLGHLKRIKEITYWIDKRS